MPRDYHAFISYTRQQGAPLANKVLKLLQGQHFNIWQDCTHMRGGKDFWSQIESAIERASYLIMIVTPDAFESDRAVLRDEWLTARRRGCAVLPVFSGLARIDFSSSIVPPWLKKLDCYDLDDANHLAKLLNDLRSTPEPRTVPHNVKFPTNFVRRNDEMTAFVTLLTASPGGTRDVMITALTGAGGFGKTMLAKALCFEDAVLARYTDGVLWLTVGEGERSPVNLLTSLLQQLGQSPQSADKDALFGQWREALRTRECLVVLDDIWRESDAEALVVRKTTSAFLITTRIPRVATFVDAHERKVEEMRADQAVQVLSLPLAEKSGQFAERLDVLADKVGYWPVLLGLIAGQLRHTLRRPGASFEQALDMAEEDLNELGLTAFDLRDKQKRENAVELTISASLRYLSQNTNHADDRYHELAVFPDDEPIEIAVLQDLWHLSRAETRRFAETFADASLATLDYAQGLLLHDVFLAYLRRQWTPTNLQKLHCQLLQQWTNVLQLPHNYAWRWYGWHCLQAGEPVRLANALLDLRCLSAKLIHADLATLLLDCQRAREAIPAQLASFAALHDALELSAHILVKAPEQLAVQLYGRLRLGQSSELDAMIQQADMIMDKQALRPVTQNLRPVGAPLKRTLTGHKGPVGGALELSDGRLLSWSTHYSSDKKTFETTLRFWTAEGQELEELSGHTSEVTGALELSDGRLLSWYWNGTLRLWTEDGQALAVLSGHKGGYPDGGVTGALELSDGRLLSWSRDKTLRLWTAESQALAVLRGHTDEVNGALELSDGRLLSWSRDKTLRLWTAEGQALAVLSGHEGKISGALELSDGRLLSWSADKTLRLWTADGQALAVLSGHTAEVTGALELSDGRLLSWPSYFTFVDKPFLLWTAEGQTLEVRSGSKLYVDGALELSDGGHKLEEFKSEELEAMGGSFNGFMELSDGRLLSWSREKTLRLWTADGQELAVLRGHEGGVDGALELSDGRLLSWSGDHSLRLWTANGQVLPMVSGHQGEVHGTLDLSDGRLLSWSADKTLRLWTVEGQALAVMSGHTAKVTDALEITDGRLLSWSSDYLNHPAIDETLRLWTAEGQALTVLSGHDRWINGALELSDGRLLSWCGDKTLRLWTAEGQVLTVMTGHEGSVDGALELSDGRLLSWSGDKTLRLWTAEGQVLTVMTGHEGPVVGALELSDGRLLSWSGGHVRTSDYTLRLWTANGQALAILSDHTDGINGALELFDGRLLSWSWDHSLRLWTANGQAQAVLRDHQGTVWGALKLSDGRLLSWSKDKTLRLWTSEGQTLAVLFDDEATVLGAMELSNGGLLAISDDQTLRLWSGAGKPLAVLYFDANINTVSEVPGFSRLILGDATGGIHWIDFQ